MKKLFFIPIAIILISIGARSALASTLEFSNGGTASNFDISVYQCTTIHSTIASSTVPSPILPFYLDKIVVNSSNITGQSNIELKLNGVSVGTHYISTVGGVGTADFYTDGIVINPLDAYEIIVNVSNFAIIRLKSTTTGSFSCISTGGDHREDDTANGIYNEIYGDRSNLQMNLDFPQASSTVPNFHYWKVSVLTAPTSSVYVVGVNWGENNQTRFQTDTLVAGGVGTFLIPKTLPFYSVFSASTSQWFARPFIRDYRIIPETTHFGDLTYFYFNENAPASTSTDLEEYYAPSIFIPTSTSQIFALENCQDNTVASSTWGVLSCNISNLGKTILNDITSAASTAVNAIANLLAHMFPVNIFYHLNADIAAVQAIGPNGPNSNATFAVPLGDTEIVFISSSTIDAAGASVGFNFREKFDYFMYIMTGAFMVLVAGWTFVHFKNKHKNKS